MSNNWNVLELIGKLMLIGSNLLSTDIVGN